MAGINYPTVTRDAVDGFLRVYNRGGLHLLFDNTSRQAMVDFTNIALKSYVKDLMEKAATQLKQQAEASEGKPIPEPAAVAVKSSLILTDM